MLQLTDNDRQLLARLDVPPPTEDFPEIFQKLTAFRNEWVLHRRQCDFTGDPIISAYPEQTIFPVYKNSVWWGDAWDPKSYGRDVDFTKAFFPQLFELQCVVPREGTSVFNSENCDFNSHIRESKNCYLNSLVYRCEDTHYCYWAVNDKDVFDCFLVNNSTLAYDCVDCDSIYEGAYLQDCQSCRDCHFSYQLRGCEQCIGCYNLVNKRLHVFNRPVSEAEFRQLKDSLLNGTREGYEKGKQIFADLFSSAPHRALHNVNVEECLGDHLLNSRRCNYAFDGNDGEDVNYTVSFGPARNVLACYSVGWPACEDVYYSVVTRGSQNIAFCYYTFFSSGLRYCDSSMSCHDSIGCIGLRQARNCILNKAYSVHDYDGLSQKLIGHMKETGEWGSFFPKDLSTFPYNQSAAQQYYPLRPEEAASLGWCWQDVKPAERHSALEVPSALASLDPNDFSTIYCCQTSSTPYRVTQPEYEFYSKLALPPPDVAPQTRHLRRLARRNAFQLYRSRCAITNADIVTTSSPDEVRRVVSEQAYQDSLN